jgi:hypothetical protein
MLEGVPVVLRGLRCLLHQEGLHRLLLHLGVHHLLAVLHRLLQLFLLLLLAIVNVLLPPACPDMLRLNLNFRLRRYRFPN